MNDQSLQEKIQHVLNERAAAIDAATLSKLRQARAKAIEQPEHWWSGINTWAASAATAVFALGLVMIIQPTSPTVYSHQQNDLEVAALGEDLEIIEELDFYHWLATQEIMSHEPQA